MSKNHVIAGLFLFVVVLVALGSFQKKSISSAHAADVNRLASSTTGFETPNDAPFLCDDASQFTASFDASMKRARIVISGTVVKTVALVPGTTSKVYSDGGATLFNFKGENVTISNPKLPKNVVCHPPLDPNNAPMNFGD